MNVKSLYHKAMIALSLDCVQLECLRFGALHRRRLAHTSFTVKAKTARRIRTRGF
jgi:hypothetical protein